MNLISDDFPYLSKINFHHIDHFNQISQILTASLALETQQDEQKTV